MQSEAGSLVVAATPLGNPMDASGRLREWLVRADVVAAEDTRRALRLAGDLGVAIQGRLLSHFDAVETRRAASLADEVAAGRTVLVITDAGMPSVSDPGLAVVRACIERGLPVTCLPGPSAVTAALVLSGMRVDRFCFEGFLPKRGPQRRRRLRELATELRTMVFFESPRRTSAALADMAEVFGPDRQVAVCRELTKTYEEVLRGPAADLARTTEGLLGEVTLVVAGAVEVVAPAGDYVEEVESLVSGGMRRSEAIAQVAEGAGVSRRELYAAVVAAREPGRS